MKSIVRREHFSIIFTDCDPEFLRALPQILSHPPKQNPPDPEGPSRCSSCFCCRGCFGLRTRTRLPRKRTEKDVVRDLGCDNQEIKSVLDKKKNTVRYLLIKENNFFVAPFFRFFPPLCFQQHWWR